MDDVNYFTGIVKILETPKPKQNNITQFRVQLPDKKNSFRILNLTFFGNLANNVIEYSKISDYIIIEGRILVRNYKSISLFVKKNQKIEILVLKVYPF